MSARDVTTVICARDAAATIARAVTSAAAQGGPVLLVDDWSGDDTVARARAAVGASLRVVRPDVHRTLGYARRAGVAAVATPWLQWLDADDAVLPGRADRLARHAGATGADAVWDAAELFDGVTGGFLRVLPMPPFMQRPGAAVRLFERNHVPGPAWPLVRTTFARAVGYDPGLPTADDLDFMLRGLGLDGRFAFVADVGYRQYAYPSSLSRDRCHQAAWVATVLRRHAADVVRARYAAAGYGPRIAAWAVVTMAAFRGDWADALQALDTLEVDAPEAHDVLEADGPWPFREGWRHAFQRGTLRLHAGRNGDAIDDLSRAEAIDPTAEGANNLGVALARCGDAHGARLAFGRALARFPAYADARANLDASTPGAITLLPLRRQPSRSEY